jgi:hypothetical protein
MDPTFLLLHFQNISSSGLLSLNYPPMYQAFTTNFAWANLIIPTLPFRNAARRMGQCSLADGASGDIGTLLPQSSSLPSVLSGSSGQGIPAFARKIGVNQRDLFAIALLVFSCACAILVGIYFIVSSFLEVALLSPSSEKDKMVWEERRNKWRGFASNNSLRIVCDPFHGLKAV